MNKSKCCVLIETLLKFCEHYRKYGNFTQSTIVEITRKRTFSGDPWSIHPKICGNCPPKENFLSRKLEEITVLYAVKAAFAIIYLCALYSSDLNFSIKYVSYSPLKILLSSRNANSA